MRSTLAILALTAVMSSESVVGQEPTDPPAQEPVAEIPVTPAFPTAEAEVALQDALDGELRQDLALSFTPHFFPSFQGGTLLVVGFRVGTNGLLFGVDSDALDPASIPAGGMPSEVAQVELFGGIYAGAEQIRSLGTAAKLDRTGVESSGLTATHSFGDTLPAGTYRFVWGIRDLVSGNVSTVDQQLEVPDLSAARLGTSSVLMVEGPPTPAAGIFAPGTVYPGVRVATASFTDRLVHAFSKTGPEVLVTFVVTGVQRDPETGSPNFSIRYQILDAAGQRIWATPAQPHARPTIGQPLRFEDVEPVSPGNSYTLVILLEDLTNNAEATTEMPFRIVE
ncbi:MAG: hypothetical protein GKS06_15740 [Acidobacteria bacterium]|nr:hypothetical protein [Acidobacteriota bacterium]